MKAIEIIKKNNEIILGLKETMKKYYNDNTDDIIPVDIENINDNYEEIINKQREDINHLNILIDIKGQNATIEMRKKIEELKVKELDKEFSNFYRNGLINIKGIDVSVDKFYMKIIEKDGQEALNFICTDERIDKKIFGTIEDREYEVKELYKFKKSRIFYEMYLDKTLYTNGKIILDNQEKLDKFLNYISKWTPEYHEMVAETMSDKR